MALKKIWTKFSFWCKDFQYQFVLENSQNFPGHSFVRSYQAIKSFDESAKKPIWLHHRDAQEYQLIIQPSNLII